jgi:hypothetical protein
MEAKTRREVVILAALVGVLGIALWWSMSNGEQPAEGHVAGAAVRRPNGAARAPAAGQPGVRNVELEALKQPKPDVASGDRDPFRFKAEAPPPPPGGGPHGTGPGGPDAVAGPVVPPGPPPLPPIPLRFIGVVDKATHKQKLAVLTDGRGVFYGSEGDIIEGRYRIVRIGVESIEMVYVDGRGSQTIRLSGS